MRQAVRFALVRNGLQFPLIAAWSGTVEVEHPNEPMQGHLSLTGEPGCVDSGRFASWWWLDWASCSVQRCTL